jgi:transaldolase/glucose-6-phosphate isomerase
MTDKNPLELLTERGQSVWLDFISRELVTTDQLRHFTDDDCVRGLTSNPTIFEKAIAEGTDYDEQIRQLAGAGIRDPDELFVEIAVSDIQRAADVMRSVYDEADGGDGFVSLEVAPGLAHDTKGTIEAAKYLWSRVERPNLMIKVPATPAGIPAIEELIAAGLNINVTLIFALTAYEQVALAYIRGLERRRAEGKPVDNRSVASFFVSRVDTETDKRLQKLLDADPGNKEAEALQGTAAIANAVLAYERFEQIFHGEEFAQLRAAGASSQRPLWASTSAKNPKYRDVVYAEALIGPETVDTMPPATIEAFRDHGIVEGDTVKSDYPGAHDVIRRLAAAGIDFDDVTQHLLDAGVESFADSYDALIRVIAEQADSASGGLGSRQKLDLGKDTKRVFGAAREKSATGVVRRIWERDPDLWKPNDADHANVIRNRLGWLDVVDRMAGEAPQLTSWAAGIAEEGVKDVVLLGMGGSSLGPEVLRSTFGSAPGFPTLHVLDTTDPAAIDSVARHLDPEHSLFVVSSKSGGTIETLSHMGFFWDLLEKAGVSDVGSHFVCVTDPGTSLGQRAREGGFRRVFENPPDIGGRYSVLSYFGLVPAALSGIDVARLLERAAHMLGQCGAHKYPLLNSGLVLGTAMGLLHDEGRDKVTILAPASIAAFSLWAEQLIAESTGKEGKGIVPIGSEPIGAPDAYADDRLFVALALEGDAEFDAAVETLRKAGQPVITLPMDDAYDLGAEFVRWEFATAVAGAHLGIDPFDEPNVAESKENTKRILEHVEREGSLPDPGAPTASGDGVSVWAASGSPGDPVTALAEHVARAVPGTDYIAFMAYVTPDGENEAALQELRTAARDSRHAATTLGFGPRFLHSTGQLHKGGPNTVVYVQITGDDAVDLPIPGRSYTFSTLKGAQAAGDLESLRSHGRRAIRVHVAGDAVAFRAAVGRLAAALRMSGAVSAEPALSSAGGAQAR